MADQTGCLLNEWTKIAQQNLESFFRETRFRLAPLVKTIDNAPNYVCVKYKSWPQENKLSKTRLNAAMYIRKVKVKERYVESSSH